MATSIKLFQFNQNYCRAIGIYSSHLNRIPFTINYKNLLFFIGIVPYIISLGAFLLFQVNSMLDIGISVFILISMISTVFFYMIPLSQSENTMKFFANCERFIENRVHSAGEYAEIIEKIERLSKVFCYAMLITLGFLMPPALLFTIINYFIYDLKNESFYLLYPIMVPFDWNTPFGYLVAWFFQFTACSAIVLTVIPFFSINFGSSWLFIFIAGDIRNDLIEFNTSKISIEKNHVMKCFCAIIRSYSDAKQNANEFKKIYQYSLLTFFVWTLLSVCSILLTVQLQMVETVSNNIEIIITSLLAVWTFGFIFFICEPGELVTHHFAKFHDELCRSNWYRFPNDVQQIYLTFLWEAQKPIIMRSYGNISCTRATFQIIINKGFSNFMVLRQMKT